MNSPSNERERLELTRANVFAIAVILAIGWLGFNGADRSRDPNGEISLDSLLVPDVLQLEQSEIQCDPLGITIETPAGFSFYAVNQKPSQLTAVSFINRQAKLIGSVDEFDPDVDQWPPKADLFQPWKSEEIQKNGIVDTVDQSIPSDQQDSIERLGVPPNSLAFDTLSDSRLQVCSVLYENVQIEWISPMKSPSWPFRVHQGRCDVAGKSILISIFELDSKSPTPVYDEGPIAAFANAIRPNDS
ncbi:hypothetical protein LOC67_09695 [Stieleria sp. JC731]|uniref:hypothetical protein n=1 Tax=Pirellulaceae TaxID=2691357 RepID=UPI001E46BF40|nr:hypothetical protein [Stieleria sp. JC731]MCC9600838.1 hypothetical protein [Stieleria sp. JC731]